MTDKNKNLPAPKQTEQSPNLIINQQEGNMLVDARLLHQRLGVKSNFRDWIKNRINEYGFKEGQDYLSVAKNLAGGGKQKDYHVPIDVAKELAMVERTEQGRAIRQYFIEAEKDLRAKRLYGQKLNISEIGKKVVTAKINGTVLYACRETRGLLGFNKRSSLTYWRNKYPGLIVRYNNVLVCSQEIVELWMLKATLTGKSEYAKSLSENKPVLGKNFGQIDLNFK